MEWPREAMWGGRGHNRRAFKPAAVGSLLGWGARAHVRAWPRFAARASNVPRARLVFAWLVFFKTNKFFAWLLAGYHTHMAWHLPVWESLAWLFDHAYQART